MLNGNVINLLDFTNCVYFRCQNLDQNVFSRKISFLASRWSQLQQNNLQHSNEKEFVDFKICELIIFKYIFNQNITLS